MIINDISLKKADDDMVTFELTSGFGTDGTAGFGNNYSWYWGWDLGRCGGSGFVVGINAANKIS